MSQAVPYNSEEREKLQQHYAALKDKASYDAFVRSAHELLVHIGIDPYHVRMAFARGKSFMELGSREAYRHSEGVGGIRVGLLMMEADVPQVPQHLNPNVRHFNPRGETAIVKFTVPTWADIPAELLALNEKAMRWEYDRIKDTKLVEIRRGSGTDNEALKHVVVNGLAVDELPGKLGLIMANLTWNSLDWKGPSQDKSNHGHVKQGNIPMESWNFDLGNPRNPPGQVLGFFQWAAPPRVEGTNNLVIFRSAGQVIGFYGKARLLRDKPRASDGNEYNLIADRSMAVVLDVKLDDIKRKGYLEEKERMGQIGFIYLERPITALHILDEAIELNPKQAPALVGIRRWVKEQALVVDNEDEALLKQAVNEVGVPDTEFFLDQVADTLSELGVESLDERVTFSLPNPRQMALTIGQRYCLGLNSQPERRFGFIALTKTREAGVDYGRYDGNPVAWYGHTASHESVLANMAACRSACAAELERTSRSGFRNHSNSAFERAVFDSAYRDYILHGRVQPASTKNKNDQMIPLNRIFYGPPGTGKTYHTIGAAVEVCDPVYYAANKGSEDALRKRFKELLIKDWQGAEGRIAFCTFHQSYGYEDFVEGIKPLKPDEADKFVKYDVRPGILRQMVRLASYHASGEAAKVKTKVSFTPDQFEKAEFYKISLGDSQNPEDQLIYEYCIKNNVIAIGFLDQHDLTRKNEQEVKAMEKRPDQTSYAPIAMNFFIHYLRDGDYVVITNGLYSVRAIGKVTGGYTYKPDSPIGYPHFRSVEWMVINEDIPYQEIYNKQFSQQTIYKLKKEDIKRDFFVQASTRKEDVSEVKRFVLIIDEINRGNVAGIFGELITLIEENKRKGKPEALEVTLPYSQEPFSIPDNLYIIGTMNTADRSVEALDAALRRRFSFVPMMPEPDMLKAPQGLRIDLTRLLRAINQRLVQLLDEDHQIGHSHLWDLHEKEDALSELKQVFKDKIIPQLEEYFHRDRAKLQLVLGERFVKGTDPADDLFLGDEGAVVHEPRVVYAVTPKDTWDETAFRSLYEKV